MADPVYFDYAATAPLDARVVAAMTDCLADPALQANPSSGHAAGRAAASRVAAARAQVARLVNAPPEAVVFTSGATESVNLAVLGAVRAAGPGCRHVVTSRVEHRAGVEACRQACSYLRDDTTTSIVVDPFCGHGTVLAVANTYGFDAVGVDLSAKRCRAARRLEI